MFSSHQHLKRKTPECGINRQEFIEHLVEEYHTTTNVEAQEQVTANLANFAYDPINWSYLKKAEALQLFVELLETRNENLQLHGSAGLCNICLDAVAALFITLPNNAQIITNVLLQTKNTEILLNCITLIYQLLDSEKLDSYKPLFATPQTLKRINELRNGSLDERLIKFCNLFLQSFGSRTELIDLNLPKLDHKQNDTYNSTTSTPTLQPNANELQESSAD